MGLEILLGGREEGEVDETDSQGGGRAGSQSLLTKSLMCLAKSVLFLVTTGNHWEVLVKREV